MLKELYGTTLAKEIHENIIYDLKNNKTCISAIYNKYIPFLWQPSKSKITTVRNRYSKLRLTIEENPILSIKRKKEALEVFKIDSNLTIYINNTSDSRAKEVINNKVEFSIKGYKEVLNYVKESILSNSFDRLRIVTIRDKQTGKDKLVSSGRKEDYILAQYSAVYLAYCTGRRPYEIAKTLKVSKYGTTTYFQNLAKKGDSNKKFKAYFIDNDYQFIKKCVKIVKEWANLDNLSNTQFNDGKAKTLRTNMKIILSDFKEWENIDYKTIRDLYSDVAINMYIREKEDEELLRLNVLAHEPRKLSATDRYRKTKGV